MLEGVETPYSPAWWLQTLATELQDRRYGRLGTKRWTRGAVHSSKVRPPLELLHDHFKGDPPLRGVAEGWEDSFREVVRIGRLNFAETSVSARTDKMGIRGFRTAAENDEFGDKKAGELMRATDLIVKARDIHDGAASLGDGYGMVTPPEDPDATTGDQRWPTFTFEDARECITAHDAATGVTLAALKLYRDEWDDADYAHLYILNKTTRRVEHHRAKLPGRTTLTPNRFRLSTRWEWDNPGGKIATLSRMPITRFKARRGCGVFEWHLDTLDRINDQILDKLVIAKIQAFRQMAVKGLPDTVKQMNPDTKRIEEVEVDYADAFLAAPGSMWQVPEGVDFWESSVTDLRPLLQSIKDDLEHYSAATKTPLHIITPSAAQGSAEGADLMRESNNFAVKADRDAMEVGWRDVAATMFAFMGDEQRAEKSAIEVLWDPLRTFSLAEMADAASKAGTSLPVDAIRRDIWQYTPEELAELRSMAGRDLLTLPAQPPARTALEPTFRAPAPATLPGVTGDPAAAT